MKAEKSTFIELLVRVSDGSFETKLVMPVDSSEQQKTEITKMWLDQLSLALKINAS